MYHNCFAVTARAKRQSNWEYVAEETKSWDNWGKDLAASNVVEGKRSRKSADRI
jgi:hypothetical protein